MLYEAQKDLLCLTLALSAGPPKVHHLHSALGLQGSDHEILCLQVSMVCAVAVHDIQNLQGNIETSSEYAPVIQAKH